MITRSIIYWIYWPLLIAESVPKRYETGKLTYSAMGRQFEERTAKQVWKDWYEPFFSFVVDNADVIRVVAYINTYWDSQFMWGEPAN